METLTDSSLKQTIDSVRIEVEDNHRITVKILNEVGQSEDFLRFYGMRYNPSCYRSTGVNNANETVYSGGDETEFRNNLDLFGRVNFFVMQYKKGKKDFLDSTGMPDILRQKLMDYVNLA
jgi:hypothetical protein